jgi:hypothetical protein
MKTCQYEREPNVFKGGRETEREAKLRVREGKREWQYDTPRGEEEGGGNLGGWWG